jgi:hypothetical protein
MGSTSTLASDVKWLFDLFGVLPGLKCILMAGNLIFPPVQLDLWIESHAPADWSFDFAHNASARNAKPPRSFGLLTAPERVGEPRRGFGVFWCSVSPNAGAFGRTPDGLAKTIAENASAFEDLECFSGIGS